jgi:hypothetical protein
VKIVRRRLSDWARMVSRPGARASYQTLTSAFEIRSMRSSPKAGRMNLSSTMRYCRRVIGRSSRPLVLRVSSHRSA